MKTIRIKGSELKSIKELHMFLKKELEFPSYYGGNLDALWDLLSGWVDLPLKIVWTDYEKSLTLLKKDALEARKLFEKAEKEITNFFFELN
jgi:ribonuclease inhibitor